MLVCRESETIFLVVRDCDVIRITKRDVDEHALCSFDPDDGFTDHGTEVLPEFREAYAAWKRRLDSTRLASWNDPIWPAP